MANDGKTINLTDRDLDVYDFHAPGWGRNHEAYIQARAFQEQLEYKYRLAKPCYVWHAVHNKTGDNFVFAGNREVTIVADKLCPEFEAAIVMHFG